MNQVVCDRNHPIYYCPNIFKKNSCLPGFNSIAKKTLMLLMFFITFKKIDSARDRVQANGLR